jgi:hypothetical protein
MEKAIKKMGRPPISDPDYNAARARKMEADAESLNCAGQSKSWSHRMTLRQPGQMCLQT